MLSHATAAHLAMHAALCFAMLRQTMPRYANQRYAWPWSSTPSYICYALPRHAMLHLVALCHGTVTLAGILSSATLCYALPSFRCCARLRQIITEAILR